MFRLATRKIPARTEGIKTINLLPNMVSRDYAISATATDLRKKEESSNNEFC
jgi:hypothetical protein